MRLGAMPCELVKGTRAAAAYTIYGNSTNIVERHRHRFEVSPELRPTLEKSGLVVSGNYRDDKHQVTLVEICELPQHPWFLGCQFHPEFLSKPLKPHPLFAAFVGAAAQRKDSGKSTRS